MYNLEIEKKAWSKGYELIGGIDEVGRGPLAGPVVAACVVARQGVEIGEKLKEVKDSKKLSEKKREELFRIIDDNFEVGVGICDKDTIDKINILQASLLAMKKALSAHNERPDFVLVDGKMKIPNCVIPQINIIKGDSKVFLIAAASIIAKVYRDQLMIEYDKKYPEYGFAKHKGYGTKFHMEALQKYGPCPIHRTSFAPVKKLIK